MQMGWWRKFPINRPLTQQEKDSALYREPHPEVVPSQRVGLIRINSTYIDWIDPYYADRGMFNTAGVLVGTLAFCLLFLGDFILVVYTGMPLFLIFQLVIVPAILFFYYAGLRYEFNTYTHYPIRFNRRTRKVYVFRHPRKGGLLIAPWDDIYFHIGDSGSPLFEQHLHNIRGQILEGDTVVDTFAVGLDAEAMQELYDRWEFIVRYMEEGPEAVASDPLDKYVELSVSSSWDNCLIFPMVLLGATSWVTYILWSPFLYWWAATRWLVFKTCEEPVFPPEVEAECQVDEDDPNIWPIPDVINHYAATIPAVSNRAKERRTKTRMPEEQVPKEKKVTKRLKKSRKK